MAAEQDPDAAYSYVYVPGAPASRNVGASMAMDVLRERISRRRWEYMLTARFRQRGSAGPGPAAGNVTERGKEV